MKIRTVATFLTFSSMKTFVIEGLLAKSFFSFAGRPGNNQTTDDFKPAPKSELKHVNAPNHSDGPISENLFELLGQNIVYDGWRKILRKEIKMPDGHTSMFDVVTQGCPSVIVFTWDSKTSTTTLIREYHPGPGKIMYGVVAGMFESKHKSALEAAMFELEEEAKLSSTQWIPLLASSETTSPCDKYSDNAFYPFLALDCESVSDPRPMDDDEYIDVEHGVTRQRLLDLIRNGELNVNSSYTVLLALTKLEEMGLV